MFRSCEQRCCWQEGLGAREPLCAGEAAPKALEQQDCGPHLWLQRLHPVGLGRAHMRHCLQGGSCEADRAERDQDVGDRPVSTVWLAGE